MMILPSLDDEVINTIKYGLPSKQIIAYATTLVVRHPKTNDLIILKWRLPWHKTEALKESDFIELNNARTWDADWSDLMGKHIIVNPVILNLNARKALASL
ncbi:hypothetical protein OB446_027160 [Paenibacillus alvei]|uniref:hypothetical protein n=1 Tax=Paenibacillus alvei TaxID=44250 RepID=UPI000288BB8E|nr:hypothetical protein [Paenibacillus alvei]EJW13957.1 hypothetical protein PAV_141p00630 [Paenibacillus alvei DSM 29]MCY9707680.1 hypothetical protein [Paenibacillus alvei]MEC0082807.1 hypothetical protein [Paenibacillus alvei]